MVCVFWCEGPICIHNEYINIHIFKAFLYVSKLLFNVCIMGDFNVVCVHYQPTAERHNVVNHIVLPVPPPPLSFF